LNDFKFTYQSYNNFLEFLVDNDYKTYTFKEWFENPTDKAVLIRHDVDLDMFAAQKLAEMEYKRHGIKATYFVMVTSPAYNLYEPNINNCLTKIQYHCNHEIGLHFDISLYSKDFFNSMNIYLQNLIDYDRDVLQPMLEFQKYISALSYHNPSVIGLKMNRYPLVKGYNHAHDSRIFKTDRYFADSCQELMHNPFDFVEKNYGQYPLQMNFHPLHYTEWGEDYRKIFDRYIKQQSKILNDFFKPNRAYRKYWTD